MASKSKQVKAPTVYAFVLYNGFITRGCTYVKVTSAHPEADEFETYKQYYSDDVKGRYVKCQKSIDDIVEGLTEKLANVVFTEEEEKTFLCKSNVTDVVKVLKEVTGAKQCSTMGVFETTEQETEEAKPAPKVVTKKVATKKQEVVEEEEEEEEQEIKPTVNKKPAAKATVVAKTATKPVAKKPAAKAVEEEEEEEPEVEVKPKKVVAKSVAKPATKTTTATKPASKAKITTELDEDLEEEIVVQTKGKTPAKGGSKTQIVIPDDDEEEEVEN